MFSTELSDGVFTFLHVPPGRYLLETPGNDERSAETEYGSLPIVVGDDDLNDVILRTQLPGIIHGHIVFDTGVPPADLTPDDACGVVTGVANAMTAKLEIHDTLGIDDDWTFTATGIIEAARLSIFAGDDNEWQIGTVTREGVDVTHVPIRDGDDIEVVLTHYSTLSGAVVDDHGTHVLGVPILIIGAAHDPAAPRNRYINVINSGDQGRFSIARVPPGRYVAAILPTDSTSDTFEPEELARLESEGTPFTIPSGQPSTVTLPLIVKSPDG